LWELRGIRNSITHDYPDNLKEKAEILNVLKERLLLFEKILTALKKF